MWSSHHTSLFTQTLSKCECVCMKTYDSQITVEEKMVKQSIQIFARVKPTKKPASVYCVDNGEPAGSILEFLVPKDLADGFINNKKETYKFRFQEVFDQTVKQEDIFEAIAKPVADSVLSGYNGTIFAYGQTGSGKTFTITGGAERYSDRGIIPRTLSYLYQHFSQDSSMVYTTHISYLEIYNEVGYDLLDPRHEASRLEDLPKVTIMEDPDQNIHLRNLSLHQSANEEEALNLLFLGDTNRMIAETPMNQASTRSHCIFTMHVCGREPGSVTVRRSKLHLVDLAGSERVGKTGVCGQLLTEAKYINLSLHYLEQVIIALSEKNRLHIPYRNSMMTSVLRDSLGGNCMTTMIATVSVDKRNVDESISTCRFAQRVALIRNEALLNEEMDPALLIVSLKREIQCLKEELSMVTGEKREDQLTQEEIHKMEELVKVFLEDPDCEVTLALGPDMRKIHYCFSLLKVMIRERLSIGDEGGDHPSPPPPVVVPDQKDSPQVQPADLTKLREMLTQRDNEINILVSILKKEKRRSKDAAAQLANISNGRSLDPQSPLRLYTASLAGDTEAVENDHGVPPTLYGERASKLSMGKQEAFEIFRRDHEDRLTIEDNKALLKQRFAEAKAYGEEVNEARNGVNKLKKQLELHRMQRAAHGVTVSPAEVEEVDPVEENIRRQMDEEKKSYKSTFGHLKTLKMEIEHLQLLLERSKVKLQRDFQDWWSQEAAMLQVPESEGMARGQSSIRTNQSSESSSPSHPMTRALSSTELSKSFFPLTGDQQTDADILGFIRARHNLLNRTGPPLP
ncbi:kinesin-like protein KIF6 isoform X1 [Oncorhynchus keta]|uniref:kinesin-like protein KIF6 isoform X1 n=3 Tax=Oncorhynchus TaxID=8016 RepID=UPI00227D5E4D|nr:kinesin-like protein KIF6 isoform X1 [Oncorhynchus keta]